MTWPRRNSGTGLPEDKWPSFEGLRMTSLWNHLIRYHITAVARETIVSHRR